jgi:hypothetical protein
MLDVCDVRTEIQWIKAECGGMIMLEVVIPLAWGIKSLRFAWLGVLDDSSLRVEYCTSV